MLPASKRIPFLFVMCLLFAFTLTIENFSQIKESALSLEPLPIGNWSIVFHPYLGPDYSNTPVLVQSATSRRLVVERFEIQNISIKAVRSVKVRWIVFENEDRGNILRQGETRLLRFRNELPSGVMGFIRFRVVSFADFYRHFLARGRLDKNLDIDLAVSEVTFSDGSVWHWEDGRSSDIKPELSKNILEADRARQLCIGRPSTQVKDAITYSCGPSQTNERCVVNGDWECTNQSCIRPGGGTGEEGYEIILD